jgi:hypothetical protein
MVKLLSVPMISMGFVSFFFFIFYLYLSLKTKNMDKQHVSYLIFSILSLVNTIYVISFAVFLNSGNDLHILSISNRITIFSSMFVVLLSLHFNKYFFDIRGRIDLVVFYLVNLIFSVLCFINSPLFMVNKLFPTLFSFSIAFVIVIPYLQDCAFRSAGKYLHDRYVRFIEFCSGIYGILAQNHDDNICYLTFRV